jgi:small subunit ribosomal protein S16
MLTIRMQRLGRKGHPTYRVVVQDSRQTPTSGKIVAMLGSYDPHTKVNTLTKEKAELYLANGAQPSERVIKLFSDQGIKLPKWVKEPAKKEQTTRNPEKLRRNRPDEPKAEEPANAEPESEAAEKPVETTPTEATESKEAVKEETPSEETPVDEKAETAEPETKDKK